MHCNVYILFIYFLLRVGCVPSGLKIKSDRDAGDDEYPFIVRLERQIRLAYADVIYAENNVPICTGVALSPSWTLTAGHCIDSASPIKRLNDNLRIQTVIRYGSINDTTAEVISTFLHPSFQDPLLKIQNNIGLLRTGVIQLKQYAHISAIDINALGYQEVTLAGHRNINSSVRLATNNLVKTMPLELLNVDIVRYDDKNESTLPTKCVAMRCLFITCDGGSGGPMLHSTGVVGINTLTLDNVKMCSAINKYHLIGLEFITPTRPHIKWINDNVKRDAVIFDIVS